MVLYGSEVANELRQEIKSEVEKIKNQGKRQPTLAVVLVGNNPASLSYVAGKEKACNEVGFGSKMIRLEETISQTELNQCVDALNRDEEVDGILVQFPLPNGLSESEVVRRITPEKDVDGLNPVNMGKLMLKEDGFVPCTPLGVMELIRKANVKIEGANAVVIGRSKLVGNPVAQLLQQANATVTIVHSYTQNIEEICRQADILVVAMGKPKKVNASWVKKGACVIDVGINRVEGKLCGDVDFDSVKEIASVVTPVPKGVGPMTITMLLKNTLQAYRMKEEGKQ